MEQVDARGQACPLPVVRAKKALAAMDAGRLEVLVDNATAADNLESLARALKCTAHREDRDDGTFAVTLSKGADIVDASQAALEAEPAAASEGEAASVVVIASEFMGAGDDELGAVLMKGFVFALTQLDQLPSTVLLYNSGVKLACEGSASLEDLASLQRAGVEVMSCGTCLAHFGLTERLAVGEVTNMYAIVEKQAAATTVIRP
ncbi:sulfurtransferase-like selenium metabolism protein YedF [Paraeggerthella hongkongensis]|uniref:Sulfurtransferase-like selenium metabolism protein YedF n=1 Tax=Paraeggerthella hongkongensis TaxID=230658 RepID=A0A3N0BJP4_9ACTN|nr:sulfurtransferase-like selenium metabolism protein YedF [Paraeggerthella hongkongensis]RNL48401.1 sulfurtransferase-like selenium metabolism protein YedF [Paraeggerthella hongkongensis]